MPSISLAIMVRDDAERLRRAIRSAAPAVDEVVILDTGSKDDTVEVAKQEGARVKQIEWPNNFAQALNSLLGEIKTEWILRLDSDEWFEIDVREAIRDCVSEDDVFAFRLIRRDIKPEGGYEEIALQRLWRHHPVIQYKGMVHENIPAELFKRSWPGKVEKLAPIWFWHDGYGAGFLDKIQRNIPLMEKELQENPGQPDFEAMLAKGYQDVGNPAWLPLMNQIVDRSLEESTPTTAVQTVIFAEILSSINVPQLQEPRTDRIIQKALEWFSASPAVAVAVYNLQMRRGRKQEALEALLLLEQMATTGQYDRSMPVNPAVFTQFWKLLDRLADQLGRWDICKRCDPHI